MKFDRLLRASWQEHSHPHFHVFPENPGFKFSNNFALLSTQLSSDRLVDYVDVFGAEACVTALLGTSSAVLYSRGSALDIACTTKPGSWLGFLSHSTQAFQSFGADELGVLKVVRLISQSPGVPSLV